MGVEPKIGVGPKTIHFIGFSLINHPFWGTTIVENTHMGKMMMMMMMMMMMRPIWDCCFNSDLAESSNTSVILHLEDHPRTWIRG